MSQNRSHTTGLGEDEDEDDDEDDLDSGGREDEGEEDDDNEDDEDDEDGRNNEDDEDDRNDGDMYVDEDAELENRQSTPPRTPHPRRTASVPDLGPPPTRPRSSVSFGGVVISQRSKRSTFSRDHEDDESEPTRTPSWTLGTKHPDFLHNSQEYFLGVPGGEQWERLLERYVRFEGLSSSSDVCFCTCFPVIIANLLTSYQVLGRIKAKPRPDQIGWWFKHGRRQFIERSIPEIKSLENYERVWFKWWTAMQPEWRDVDSWPFSQDEGDINDWGNLIHGGKDGLYVVVVSLAWWVHARDPVKESLLDDAIADVSWVLDQLVSSLLSSTTTAKSAPPPRTHARETQLARSAVIGPPKKRQRI